MDRANIHVGVVALALLASCVCNYPLVAATEQQNCKRSPVIINFGDSNSDTGGASATLGYWYNQPDRLDDGRTFFNGRPTGRYCDGRLILDFLCESVGTGYLRPYLDATSVVGTNFNNGINFAVAGAGVGVYDELAQYTVYNLDSQVYQYHRFRFISLNLSSDQPGQWLSQADFESGVYTLDLGQNDLYVSFAKNHSEAIPKIIYVINQTLIHLYGNGARRFWIHNTGPLGCLPMTANTDFVGDRDPSNCLVFFNDAARTFNTELARLCDSLRLLLANATIVYVDIFAVKYDIIANATSYGFDASPMTPCYNGTHLCPMGSKHISWDGTHYTEAANSIVAAKIMSGNYSNPPIPFNAFCNM